MEKRKFDLEERMINYSIKILEVSEIVFDTSAGKHLSGQFIRSGTSPALVMQKLKVQNQEMISFIK